MKERLRLREGEKDLLYHLEPRPSEPLLRALPPTLRAGTGWDVLRREGTEPEAGPRPRQPPGVTCLVSVDPLLRYIERLLVTSPRS